ncbi:MAG: M20/M25/M40 family metallo-hydrolase [Spirochaetales bacterium]|nr:M20/M25/M40 family metallo-hydrolase [Spirochaetales bacterium]
MEKQVVTLLKQMIQNACVNDGTLESGQEIRNALLLKEYFEKNGIKGEILEKEKNRSNFLARIPGKSRTAPSLMFMCHLDVVPANEDDWSCNPFGAEERGGYIWGRGAQDMLGIAAASAVAFVEIVKEQKQLAGDFIFLATADEESSGRHGARWLVEKHWEKIKCDYMVTEAGGFFIKHKGKRALNMTVGEKGLAWTRISAKGTAGHGSLPYFSDNAAVKLSRALAKLAKAGNRLELSGLFKSTIKSLPYSWLTKLMLKTPLLFKLGLKRIQRISPGLARYLHAISHTTLSPNIIKVGQKINIIPDQGIIELDIRILPGQTIESVVAWLEKELKIIDGQFSVEVLDYFPANVSETDTPLYEASIDVMQSIYPDCRDVPMLFSGVTDARFFRMRGTRVYGFSLYDQNMTLERYVEMLHGRDERISIDSLAMAVNYFYRVPSVFYQKITW